MHSDKAARLKALKTTEEAARWFYELRSEETADHSAYLEWLLESPQHVEAFLRVAHTDASLSKLDPERSIEMVPMAAGRGEADNVVNLPGDGAVASPATPTNHTRIGGMSRRRWAVAASMAIIGVAAALIWVLRDTGTEQATQYITAVGEQRAIALEDGSLLHMNTDSRVEVTYSGHERSLRLLAGEALFRVQPDLARPFRVHSGGITIQAVGTQFNVLRTANASTVSVLEGRVKVDGNLRPVATGASANEQNEFLLGAGEEARVTDGASIAARGKANIARVTAWRQRRLVFINETLGAIVAEFGRYNRALDIEVAASAAQMRGYETMSFNADDPESLLAVLERDPNLEVVRRDGKVIIRRR